MFVDPSDDDAFDLDTFSRTYGLLERALPDLELGYSTRDGLVPVYRPHIEREAIRIF